MSLDEFRVRVKDYRQLTGISQKELAQALGLHPNVLSHKLNGSANTTLTHQEVRQIVKLLAEWEAITEKAQAVELLSLMRLKPTAFNEEEWQSRPLNKLAHDSNPVQVVPPSSPRFRTEASNSGRPPSSLPNSATPFIGREWAISRILAILERSEVRLLTLTGPGGIGKTRLALQLAERCRLGFRDGVYFVDLTRLSDPFLVPAEISRILDVKETYGDSPLESLKLYLQDRQVLLVLDNFEHLIEAANTLAELLEAIPSLKMLATSREILHLYGEYQFGVPPLDLPALKFRKIYEVEGLADPASFGRITYTIDSVEQLNQYESIRLFVERAKAVQPEFELDEQNASVIVEICHRLDGLPLALELAAVRIKLLSPEILLEKLTTSGPGSQKLELLRGGARNLPERQRTLRNTIEWSYNLLDSGEQQLLKRLAIFQGGWTVAAALEICDKEGNFRSPVAMLEALGMLVDKSLIKREQLKAGAPNPPVQLATVGEQLQLPYSPEPTFTILETIREFLLEKLEETGEALEFYVRHATYYLKLVEPGPLLTGGIIPTEWAIRLEGVNNNLRATLGRFERLGKDYLEIQLRLLAALAPWWFGQGHYSEGRHWLGQGLSQFSSTNVAQFPSSNLALHKAAAQVLHGAGLLALYQGDYSQAENYYHDSLTLFEKLGDKPGTANLLFSLAHLARIKGNYGQARQLYLKVEELQTEFGDELGLVSTRAMFIAAIWHEGQYQEAREMSEKGLSWAKEKGNRFASLVFESMLIMVALSQDRLEEAARLLEQNLEFIKNSGIMKRYSLLVIMQAAYLAIRQEDFEMAHRYYGEVLETYLDSGMGDKWFLAVLAEGMAGLALVEGGLEQAACLFGIAEGLFERLGVPRYAFLQETHDRDLTRLQKQLNPVELQAAWAKGSRMNFAQIYAVVKKTIAKHKARFQE